MKLNNIISVQRSKPKTFTMTSMEIRKCLTENVSGEAKYGINDRLWKKSSQNPHWCVVTDITKKNGQFVYTVKGEGKTSRYVVENKVVETDIPKYFSKCIRHEEKPQTQTLTESKKVMEKPVILECVSERRAKLLLEHQAQFTKEEMHFIVDNYQLSETDQSIINDDFYDSKSFYVPSAQDPSLDCHFEYFQTWTIKGFQYDTETQKTDIVFKIHSYHVQEDDTKEAPLDVIEDFHRKGLLIRFVPYNGTGVTDEDKEILASNFQPITKFGMFQDSTSEIVADKMFIDQQYNVIWLHCTTQYKTDILIPLKTVYRLVKKGFWYNEDQLELDDDGSEYDED